MDRGTGRVSVSAVVGVLGLLLGFVLTWAFKGPAMGSTFVGVYLLVWLMQSRWQRVTFLAAAGLKRIKGVLHQAATEVAPPTHQRAVRILVSLGLASAAAATWTIHSVGARSPESWLTLSMLCTAVLFGYVGWQCFNPGTVGRMASYGMGGWFVALAGGVVPAVLGVGKPDDTASEAALWRDARIEEVNALGLMTVAASLDTANTMLSAVNPEGFPALLNDFKHQVEGEREACLEKRRQLGSHGLNLSGNEMQAAEEAWATLPVNLQVVAQSKALKSAHFTGLYVSLKNVVIQEDTCLRQAIWRQYEERCKKG